MSQASVSTLRGDMPYWDERCRLACAFRWAARLNFHEAVANHFSLAISDDGCRFLINPDSRHFSRIRASELLVLDANDADTMQQPNAPDPSAWALHGAVHRNLAHARCVLHVHSKYATVLASLADSGMPPIDQNTMRFYDRIAIDDGFDGLGLGAEAERVCKRFGNKSILLMGNHGVMITAHTVAQAFDELYYFERACETLITAYMTGQPLRIVSHEVASKTARQWSEYQDFAVKHFQQLTAILDEEEPDYKH